MKSLTQCIQAAQKKGVSGAVEPHGASPFEKKNYNYKTKNIKNYNYNNSSSDRRYRGSTLYQEINSDKLLLLGQSWGMSGGLLYNLSQSHGLDVVKRSIDFVSRLPESKRNGRYCRVVILNGGPKSA